MAQAIGTNLQHNSYFYISEFPHGKPLEDYPPTK